MAGATLPSLPKNAALVGYKERMELPDPRADAQTAVAAKLALPDKSLVKAGGTGRACR
jgi:hypothetical protein